MSDSIKNDTTLKRVQVPVFVIGAGPAGLTTTAFLAKQGIETLAVSMHPGTANTPRAHITNTRAMEVFRDLGIEDKVMGIASTDEMHNVIWCTNVAGKELVRLNSWGYGDDRLSDYHTASPSRMCNAAQHVLEPVLLETARGFGAKVLFNNEVIGVEQTDDKVYSLVEDKENGEKYIVESDFVVGADGARSVVANTFGFEFDGMMGQGHAMNVWFDADLSKYTAHRHAVLYPTLQPGNDDWIGGGTFICIQPWNSWVLLYMYNPDNEEAETSEQAVVNRIHSLIGDDNIGLKINMMSKWTVNNMFAKETLKGRVAIIGDAAHRHPPSGGLGSNTCVQDAFNLAWKVEHILKGKAGMDLLQSFSVERSAAAKQMVNRAITAMINMQNVPQALGLRPGQTEEEGWAAIDKFRSSTEEGKQMRKDVREAMELQNWQFNGIGGEAGHHYQSNAVVSDGTTPEFTADNEHLKLYPTTTPGSVIPHAWVQRDDDNISTLDLVGNGAFTIITGLGGEPWLECVKDLSASLGLDIRSVQITMDGDIRDLYCAWADVNEIEDDGCLIVRPDRYVAYRAKSMVANPQDELSKAFKQILALNA